MLLRGVHAGMHARSTAASNSGADGRLPGGTRAAAVRACRWAAAAATAAAACAPNTARIAALSRADAVVAAVWGAARASAVFRHDSFEPLLVLVAFSACLLWWWCIDHALVGRRWAKAFQLCPGDSSLAHWRVEDGTRSRLCEVVAVFVAPVLLMDVLWPRRAAKVDAAGDIGFLQLIVQVLVGLLAYDVLFALSHLAMHKHPLLWKIHAKHHDQTVVRARDTIRLHPLDEAIDVGCSIAAVNLMRLHPLARSLYNAVIILALCDLHSGWDVPCSLENLLGERLWGGSRRHHAHHLGTCKGSAYSKFFPQIDAAIDTAGLAASAMASRGAREGRGRVPHP